MNMNVFTVVAATGLASVASAAVVEFAFDINNFGNTSGNVINFSFDFEAIAGGQIANINSISIELSHSWAGDIDFYIIDPGTNFFDLVYNQGGSSDLGDGGSDGTGLGLYTFVESAGGITWGDSTAPGTYEAGAWGTDPFASGNWTILLNDLADFDDGAVGSVFIDYDVVPAPSAMALLGLGGIVAGRRRR